VSNCNERYAGYLAEMQRLGLPVPDPVYLLPTMKDAYEQMKGLIQGGAYVPHAAVVADNDTVAIGAAKAILEEGSRIPEDVSIIGVDDVPFSAMTTPPLTTMRVSRRTLGVLAVDIIRKRIDHPKWPSMHMQITGSLIVRGSTMRAAKEG
jgi:LacI family transcriptional regulator